MTAKKGSEFREFFGFDETTKFISSVLEKKFMIDLNAETKTMFFPLVCHTVVMPLALRNAFPIAILMPGHCRYLMCSLAPDLSNSRREIPNKEVGKRSVYYSSPPTV